MLPSHLLVLVSVAVILGIVIGSFFASPLSYLLAGFFVFALAGLFGLLFFRPIWFVNLLIVSSLIFVVLILGAWRYVAVEKKLARQEILQYLGQQVILTGKIIRDPEPRDDRTNLVVEVETINLKGRQVNLPQNQLILITTRKEAQFFYGEQIQAIGLLKEPFVSEKFNYQKYLQKIGISGAMNFPKIEIRSPANWQGLKEQVLAKLFQIKTKTRQLIYENFSRPHDTFMIALLFGEQNIMPKELQEKFNITGLRHLVAISGQHITLIALMVLQVLLFFGLWRYQALWLTLFFILLYIVLVGAPASALRAGVMAGLATIAQVMGRLADAWRALIFAAALLLLVNPLSLRWDAGFQLSFLATMGIVQLTPIFNHIFKNAAQESLAVLNLRSIISMTLSAQLFTLPLGLYHFGLFSAVAPLTNLLVLLIIPLTMGLALLFMMLGLVWPGFAWLISLAIFPLLQYVSWVVDVFGSFVFSAWWFQISPLILVLLYGLIFFATYKLKKWWLQAALPY